MKNKYEIFYDIDTSGGHGGPYNGIQEAKEAAKRKFIGCPSINTIHIISYKEWSRNLGVMRASFVIKR